MPCIFPSLCRFDLARNKWLNCNLRIQRLWRLVILMDFFTGFYLPWDSSASFQHHLGVHIFASLFFHPHRNGQFGCFTPWVATPFPGCHVTTRIVSCWVGNPELNLHFHYYSEGGQPNLHLCLRNILKLKITQLNSGKSFESNQSTCMMFGCLNMSLKLTANITPETLGLVGWFRFRFLKRGPFWIQPKSWIQGMPTTPFPTFGRIKTTVKLRLINQPECFPPFSILVMIKKSRWLSLKKTRKIVIQQWQAGWCFF